MATTRTFQTMLNEYLPNSLFKDELIERDWYLKTMTKDNNWKGGDIIVPFQGNSATSVKFGGLTADTDISEYDFVRGKISGYKEVWGSLIFNETDIMQHDGRVNEQSFLRILPDQIEDFMMYIKMATSINLLSGPHFAKITDVTNKATGILVVDKIDRFEIQQKVQLCDGATTLTVYVKAININTNELTLSASRGGVAGGVGTATTSFKAYHDGILAANVATGGFITARQALLPASLGGADSLHGQTKLSYPALQSIQIDGTGITAITLLDKLFDAWTTLKTKAKAASPDKCVMSYKHMGAAMKAIENGLVSGGQSIARVVAKTPKISKYGWTEIEIVGIKGSFTLVGIQEMDDDVIYFMDMSAMTFRTNGFFQKKKSPEGLEYYRIRSTSGYKLVCDICLFGEQEFRKPSTCAVIHSISY
jgi:hypothetical protein